jgi:hypothetical protein
MEGEQMGGIYLVLDSMNWEEVRSKRRLSHDGGKLLLHIINRLSIPRQQWAFGYCFEGSKKQMPMEASKKAQRQVFLKPHLEKLAGRIAIAKQEMGGLQIVGLGRLSCECLTGSSELKKKACTSWKVNKLWEQLVERAWVTYSTEAALFNCGLYVDIGAVLAAAATKAGIEIRMKDNNELTPFDWSPYEHI